MVTFCHGRAGALESSYTELAKGCGVQLSAAVAAQDCALVRELRAYAAAAAAAVGNNKGPITSVDFIFPGAAYFSVACGGFWDVLTARGHAAASAAGASGGACSAFLLLAGGCDLLIMGYLLYARHQGASTAMRLASVAVQAVRVTPFWGRLYRHVLDSSEDAWEAVQARAYVAVASRARHGTPMSAVRAYGKRGE